MKLQLSPIMASLFLVLTAAAQAQEPCPSLPSDSGLVWRQYDGPDFTACYAMEAEGKDQAFSIYFGNFPNVDQGAQVMAGNVGGRDVVWYRGHDKDHKLSIEAVVSLQDSPGRSMAHVWASADTEPVLHHRLAILQHLTF